MERSMTKYPVTKSDPICKWRTASIKTVIELVSWLPKIELSSDKFREYMRNSTEKDFFHTPYQLACQLALYLEDDGKYIPRFDHNIDKNEAEVYMKKWMKRYYVPNPYTKRGFINIAPSVNLLNSLVEYLNEHPTKPNLATAGAALFGGPMGNLGSVKYVLNEYSQIINVDKDDNMILLQNEYGKISVTKDRDDKIAFFEHFD